MCPAAATKGVTSFSVLRASFHVPDEGCAAGRILMGNARSGDAVYRGY